jgi:hypothetical protein
MGKPKHGGKDTIKMDIQKTRRDLDWTDLDWTDLAQDKDR